jgi:hypothetical protein
MSVAKQAVAKLALGYEIIMIFVQVLKLYVIENVLELEK